jgi:hypothetical protein
LHLILTRAKGATKRPKAVATVVIIASTGHIEQRLLHASLSFLTLFWGTVRIEAAGTEGNWLVPVFARMMRATNDGRGRRSDRRNVSQAPFERRTFGPRQAAVTQDSLTSLFLLALLSRLELRRALLRHLIRSSRSYFA